jgi:hypothetical protein
MNQSQNLWGYKNFDTETSGEFFTCCVRDGSGILCFLLRGHEQKSKDIADSPTQRGTP